MGNRWKLVDFLGSHLVGVALTEENYEDFVIYDAMDLVKTNFKVRQTLKNLCVNRLIKKIGFNNDPKLDHKKGTIRKVQYLTTFKTFS